ncbi:OsmC family protein [Paralcaligenes ureilyticus]|uniref:Organic hydroperoxide reductase OsmC/OhrA n=1 Tax=Paralcaligenes ureilyticus TaxID=627131 RepID=A0A4V6NZJ2_9BURK|nr:OsmC family protein [Paralcaligenes ureilyticus]TCT04878.1 organic hydroperoxide reductase OsmC/OhrA [Paralcaligenes ureilyticus]
MAEYVVEVSWTRNGQDFLGKKYSRKHTLRFDGGAEVHASSSPHVVPAPLSDKTAVDPEELFVSALSSCHMLWFLSIAAKQGFCVDQYLDKAAGVMGENTEGNWAMTLVTLKPEVSFSGEKIPTKAQLENMHHEAHEECFIANSVKTEVRCEPQVAKA